MKVWMRNSFFLIAVLIFLLASSFFILLALGYNYDFSKNKFEKTSVLYLKSYPRRAHIFLNNEEYKNDTPTEITHLKPDLYNIRIEREEYQSWEKQFLIKPEQTVFVEDISLFYKVSQVSILKNGNFKEISISPNKENLLFYDLENKDLNIFNLTENKIINIESDINLIAEGWWSDDNQKILLKSDNTYYISFVYFNNPLLVLNDYVNFSLKKIVWDKFDSNLLYLISENNQLFRFNLEKRNLEAIHVENVISVKPEKEKLFYISAEEENDVFYVLNLNRGEKQKILDLGQAVSYEFRQPYNDFFCLLDSDATLYLIDPNKEDYLMKKFYNVQDLKWDLYNRVLLLKNDFEIWSYDLITKEEFLINRFSKKIEDIFWHRNNNHIFYILEGELYVIELDNRDKRNFYDLKNIYNSKLFLANKRGNILYHITPSGLIQSIIQ